MANTYFPLLLDSMESNGFGNRYTKEEIESMQVAFDGCDRSKVGRILPEELKELLVVLGEDETDENVWQILASANKGQNDRISFEEFLQALEHHNFSFVARKASIETNPFEKAFLVFDLNRDGFITKAEMRTAAKRLNISELDDNTIEKLFDLADGDNDGRINLEEYAAAVKGSSR